MHNNEALLKNRYYKGKLLRSEDFVCEQQYHENSQSRLLKNYLGSGIVNGLVVTKKENQRLLISEGHCIDDNGKWVSLTKDKDIALEEIPGFEILDQNEAWLCINYQEIESNKIFAAISEENGQEEFNNIQESYALSLQPYKNPIRNAKYHDISTIYEDKVIKITQWIPKYISEYQSFCIMILVENMTVDTHQVSFNYLLQSMEIIDAQKSDIITINGTCLLEKENIFTYFVKKNPRHGSLNYAHFTLLNTNAKVCIDDIIYSISSTYQQSFPIVKELSKYLLTTIQQTKQKDFLVVENPVVPIAHLQLKHNSDKTEIVLIDQTKVNHIITTKISKQVDDILAMYGISKQLEVPVPTIEPSEIAILPNELKVNSDVITIDVPRYRRNQLPIITKEISYHLEGLVYMSWAIEKKGINYPDNHQAKEQYFGDVSLFSNKEDYQYAIGCKVIESRQTFKLAIKACKGTPNRSLTIRYYAIGFEKTTPKEPMSSMKVVPEFIILKPGQQTYFSVVFIDATKEEVCDFTVDTKDGGSILTNGLYTAPLESGVYKITITGRTSKNSIQAAVVVKEET